MSAKTISILNSPASSHGDASVVNGTMTITGLSPMKTGTMQSLQIQRNLVATPQKWTSSFTAGTGVVCAFTLQQTVNGLLKALTFVSSGTTTAAVMAELNSFFGASATYGAGTFTSATEFDVEYKYASNVLYIQGTTANPICSVTADVTNTSTIASNMTLTLESQTQTASTSAALLFKVTAHGLSTGNMIYVGTLTGQVGANNNLWRVVYVSANTFNLVDPVTLDPALCDGTTTTPAGTVTLIAQPDFGSQAYVNADAVLNGSAETATSTTYNYSAVDIVPFYTSDVAPNPSMRTAPCRVWIPDAGATTTVSTDGQALLDYLAGYIV
jgi:hypothetical protein